MLYIGYFVIGNGPNVAGAEMWGAMTATGVSRTSGHCKAVAGRSAADMGVG